MRIITENMTIQECRAVGMEGLYRYKTRWETLKLQNRITWRHENSVQKFFRDWKEKFQ
jgi:hypothetical protein